MLEASPTGRAAARCARRRLVGGAVLARAGFGGVVNDGVVGPANRQVIATDRDCRGSQLSGERWTETDVLAVTV